MNDVIPTLLLGALIGVLAYALLDMITDQSVDHDLVRCPTMLEWCDGVGTAGTADLEAATACAWYYGSCK